MKTGMRTAMPPPREYTTAESLEDLIEIGVSMGIERAEAGKKYLELQTISRAMEKIARDMMIMISKQRDSKWKTIREKLLDSMGKLDKKDIQQIQENTRSKILAVALEKDLSSRSESSNPELKIPVGERNPRRVLRTVILLELLAKHPELMEAVRPEHIEHPETLFTPNTTLLGEKLSERKQKITFLHARESLRILAGIPNLEGIEKFVHPVGREKRNDVEVRLAHLSLKRRHGIMWKYMPNALDRAKIETAERGSAKKHLAGRATKEFGNERTIQLYCALLQLLRSQRHAWEEIGEGKLLPGFYIMTKSRYHDMTEDIRNKTLNSLIGPFKKSKALAAQSRLAKELGLKPAMNAEGELVIDAQWDEPRNLGADPEFKPNGGERAALVQQVLLEWKEWAEEVVAKSVQK